MATFTTTLIGDPAGSAGIHVPDDVIDNLAAGKRPPVLVTLNGHTFASTVAVMGGRYLIAVNAAVRKQTGLSGGDTVEIQLTLDTSPRTVHIPHDLAAALAEQGSRTVFDRLTASQQRRIVTGIEDAKNAQTRTRRIDKALLDLTTPASRR